MLLQQHRRNGCKRTSIAGDLLDSFVVDQHLIRLFKFAVRRLVSETRSRHHFGAEVIARLELGPTTRAAGAPVICLFPCHIQHAIQTTCPVYF